MVTVVLSFFAEHVIRVQYFVQDEVAVHHRHEQDRRGGSQVCRGVDGGL